MSAAHDDDGRSLEDGARDPGRRARYASQSMAAMMGSARSMARVDSSAASAVAVDMAAMPRASMRRRAVSSSCSTMPAPSQRPQAIERAGKPNIRR